MINSKIDHIHSKLHWSNEISKLIQSVLIVLHTNRTIRTQISVPQWDVIYTKYSNIGYITNLPKLACHLWSTNLERERERERERENVLVTNIISILNDCSLLQSQGFPWVVANVMIFCVRKSVASTAIEVCLLCYPSFVWYAASLLHFSV